MNQERVKEAFSKVKENISSLEGDLAIAKLDLVSLKKDTQIITASLADLITILNQNIHQTHHQQLEYIKLMKEFMEANVQQTSRQTQLLEEIHSLQKNTFASQNIQEIFQKLLQQPTPAFQQLQRTQIPTQNPAYEEENPTNRHIIPTHPPKIVSQEQIPADNKPFYSLISSYKETSTRNEGVPTDKPTDRQTNQQTAENPKEEPKNEKIAIQTKLNNLNKATEILASLDSLKKEIRLKFKRLTNQEVLIFSTIYQLEEEGNLVDYPFIAETLALSESSVRDYVQKIISKGIPIQKEKINNKKVLLSISPDLKKIASLNTILQLRDL